MAVAARPRNDEQGANPLSSETEGCQPTSDDDFNNDNDDNGSDDENDGNSNIMVKNDDGDDNRGEVSTNKIKSNIAQPPGAYFSTLSLSIFNYYNTFCSLPPKASPISCFPLSSHFLKNMAPVMDLSLGSLVTRMRLTGKSYLWGSTGAGWKVKVV